MNRRGFLGTLIRSAIAGALASSTRWLPMPEPPKVRREETLLEYVQRTAPSGPVASIADVLSQHNPLLDEMVVALRKMPRLGEGRCVVYQLPKDFS